MDVGKGLCLFEHTKKSALGARPFPLRAAGNALTTLTSVIGTNGTIYDAISSSDDDDGDKMDVSKRMGWMLQGPMQGRSN